MKSFYFLFISSILFSSDINISEKVPKWIELGRGENIDYIYGVGSAPQNINFQQQEKIAKMSARASLSENISVHVESEFQHLSANNRSYRTYLIIQKSTNLIKEATVENSWINKDGDLYILMAIPKKNINSNPE